MCSNYSKGPKHVVLLSNKDNKDTYFVVFDGFISILPKPSSSTLFTKLGSSEDPMVFFFVISQLFDAVDYSKYFLGGFWNYNSVVQALLASNILCLFISTEVTVGTELLHTQSSLIQHLNNVIFWTLSAGHFSNLQLSEPKNNPKCVFNFLHFFLKEQFISLIT